MSAESRLFCFKVNTIMPSHVENETLRRKSPSKYTVLESYFSGEEPSNFSGFVENLLGEKRKTLRCVAFMLSENNAWETLKEENKKELPLTT